jgi:hypothetical protein
MLVAHVDQERQPASPMGFSWDRSDILMLTFAVAGAILVAALAVALLRAVREQVRAERPPRERPLGTPPPAPKDDPPPPPVLRK